MPGPGAAGSCLRSDSTHDGKIFRIAWETLPVSSSWPEGKTGVRVNHRLLGIGRPGSGRGQATLKEKWGCSVWLTPSRCISVQAGNSPLRRRSDEELLPMAYVFLAAPALK
ncbi:hypothetical protein NDU88_002799 [Pleurodeles waltl]|uniref:Uncharacterized protein n=1 Tax=Pleurodeles waltl TaxID=8319 RepID=A0AAV7QAX0_PLEWA|nr:hypothetical protein NDU88_002799 [Pleurodeles waltl]